MKKITIEVPEGHEVIVQPIKNKEKKLATSWEEYWNAPGPYLETLPDYYLALRKLELLVEHYNDGWKPDYTDDNYKYQLYFYKDQEIIRTTHPRGAGGRRVLTFKTKELRDKFLENFKDLIEEAKPLL